MRVLLGVSEIRPAWAEIDLDAIKHNVRRMKESLRGGTRMLAVVKADGYGHGSVEVSRAALEAGAEWLGVAMLDEALHLRRAGIKSPVLVLGYTPVEQAARVVSSGVTQTVWTGEMIEALLRASDVSGGPAHMHIKIDSGMGRIGARPGEELGNLLALLKSWKISRVNGVFSHFAVADTDPEYTEQQFARFMEGVEQIRDAGIDPGILHCCGSAGLLRYPEYHLDMVRPGIVLYGYPPVLAEGFRISLRFVARISHVKCVAEGTSVSYGRTYTATCKTMIATVPVGYADGYRRGLSNKGIVRVKGSQARIAGRVCMDQFMIDVTHLAGTLVGDKVELISADVGSGATAEDLAVSSGTIVNDILTGLSPRIPRIYRTGGTAYMYDALGERITVNIEG